MHHSHLKVDNFCQLHYCKLGYRAQKKQLKCLPELCTDQDVVTKAFHRRLGFLGKAAQAGCKLNLKFVIHLPSDNSISIAKNARCQTFAKLAPVYANINPCTTLCDFR